MVFKSKYPKNYGDGPDQSIKSIHTPLMGEVNFVHAKRPKHMKKNSEYKSPREGENNDDNQI